MAQILLLNGPNLNLLGTREPGIYGDDTLEAIIDRLASQADAAGHTLEHLQSNNEAELIECVHAAARQSVDYIIINPAAFTHTSVALRDAFQATQIPFVEIHISNIHRREAFRQHSYFSDIAAGCIIGLGTIGYDLALEAIINLHKTKNT